MSYSTVYCVNHPNTETLLRCYRCGRPVCVKCVKRTPVGLICRDCLSNQQSGFYTATTLDYAVAATVGLGVSIAGGAIAGLIGFFLFEIFFAPFAGGIIAEAIRVAIQKRRGRYVWLIGCLMVVIGAIIGAGLFRLLRIMTASSVLTALMLWPGIALSSLFNLGILIYVILAVATVYARLRLG